jgi:hypothetical protein
MRATVLLLVFCVSNWEKQRAFVLIVFEGWMRRTCLLRLIVASLIRVPTQCFGVNGTSKHECRMLWIVFLTQELDSNREMC